MIKKKHVVLIGLIFILIFIGNLVISYWQRGENIISLFLDAKSYYIEYDLFYSNSNDQVLVREWYISPHQYYQERSVNGEVTIQIWSSSNGTVWRNVVQSDSLKVAQYVPSTVWQSFSKLAGQPAFKQEHGYYLALPGLNKPKIKLEFSKKGEPIKITVNEKAGSWEIVFREYKTNIKIDTSIMEPFVT
ncbi:hypothetical protein IMX26_14510 [Clostridium sp. 'deep sea']|uniref:hypothetical protein n=1 Tax=Clostridium sp. 'deep sea' TaxID=2779445 RepID=UPI0018968797|nr:hypothetical protein [Clostridium sp. 'deep sea']QOR34670.1 hypothetical protein IMX26_14510 [Clostridium sp. 'deep sea']